MKSLARVARAKAAVDIGSGESDRRLSVDDAELFRYKV